ncbi:AMP-binding protein [Paraburkholderia phytofirmans]|uniref:AMP-binding protein n=1 Tax=Paraburkholderia phytofirmans TaxID=261302 RepID=UPI0038BA0DEC
MACALYAAGLVKVALNARLSAAEAQETIIKEQARIVLVGGPHIEVIKTLLPRFEGVERFVAIEGEAADFLRYEALFEGANSTNPDVEMQASDLAVLHFTSGPTGKLKAAMQTVGNRMASLCKVVIGRMPAPPGDALALAAPITHASGVVIEPFLSQGGTILLHDRFDPDSYLDSQHVVWRSAYRARTSRGCKAGDSSPVVTGMARGKLREAFTLSVDDHRLAKKPRSIEFVSELPKDGNGKMSRKYVRERYWRGHERRVT